jgi:hypothetical protein
MRFLMLVNATQDSEAGAMPEEKLIRAKTSAHQELARASMWLDASGLMKGRGEHARAQRFAAIGWWAALSVRGPSPYGHGPYGASERGALGSCSPRDWRYRRQPRRNAGHVGTVGSGSVFSGKRPQSAG